MSTLVKLPGPKTRRHRPLTSPWKWTNLRLLQTPLKLEQLDGVGVELSSLYKCIEKQVPNGCCTETWKNRTHWAGTPMPSDASASVAQAEEYLQTHRPMRRSILNLINRVGNFQPSPKRKDFFFFLARHILTTFRGISFFWLFAYSRFVK